MPNPHDAIRSLASHLNLPAVRRVESPRLEGREQPSTDTPFVIPWASVQTPNGRDLQRLSEGQNAQDLRVVFAQVEIKSGGPGTGFLSDLITIDGGPYEVEHVEPWHGFTTDPGVFWRAVVRRRYAV